MEKEPKITCLEDVAAYLRNCKQRPIPNMGLTRFEPQNMEDLTTQVRSYLDMNREHGVTMTMSAGFLSLSDANLARLNAQLPEKLKLRVHSSVDSRRSI